MSDSDAHADEIPSREKGEWQDVPHAVVEFEVARELADAVSIGQDLDFVIEALTRLNQLLDEASEPDGVLSQAYWSAALVAYVRCFSSGKRSAIDTSVFDGVRGPNHTAGEVHVHFKNMRDKHVAHSVNPFEQVAVALMLSAEPSEKREVQGVGTLYMRWLSPSQDGVSSLLELAKIARQEVAVRATELKSATLDQGRRMSIDELYELAGLKLVVPPPEEAGNPR